MVRPVVCGEKYIRFRLKSDCTTLDENSVNRYVALCYSIAERFDVDSHHGDLAITLPVGVKLYNVENARAVDIVSECLCRGHVSNTTAPFLVYAIFYAIFYLTF